MSSVTLINGIKETNPEILVVRNIKVKKEVIMAGPKIKLIVKAGANADNIESEICNERGIFIACCPELDSNAIAELAIGLMINVDRRLGQ